MSCCTDDKRSPNGGECGQATVEAAFALPIVFALLGLLLQPAVLLYDRCVMRSAAAEACRLVATQSCSEDAVKAFVLRRLAAVPQLDLFHTAGCDWDVRAEGGGAASAATIRIEGHVRTLPLLGISASTMTSAAGDGCALLSCEATSSLYPAWAAQAGVDVQECVAQWE